MKSTTNALGDVGMTQHICENPSCGKTCILVWRDLDGREFCSNKCSIEAKENMSEETELLEDETEVEEIEETPAPKKGKKGSMKKATAKKAPAKKVAVKATKKAPAKKGPAAATHRGKGLGMSDPRVKHLIGGTIQKDYHGKKVVVKVTADGFEFEKRKYTSLSKLASELCNNSANGFTFFGLNPKA